jgi:hypothetical protein
MNTSRISFPLTCQWRGYVALVLLLISCLWAASATAKTTVTNIIYENMFSGVGPLNGWARDTVDVSTNTWSASANWTITGSAASESGSVSCGFLPFVPLAGRIYTLSANILDEGPSWTALGFTGTANTQAYFGTDVNAVGWQLVAFFGGTGGNVDQTFIGPNTLGGPQNPVSMTRV